jgi:FtsP/CotA-like multicopper oxidase with cupredoxin domain
MAQTGTRHEVAMLEFQQRILPDAIYDALLAPFDSGSYLPQEMVRLFLAPAERADVIIDFAGWAGHNLTLNNDIQVPFPSGGPMALHLPMQQVMQFRVNLPLSSRDSTYDPASGQPLRGGPDQEPIIVRLTNPAAGILAPGVTPSATLQLVLFEFEDPFGNGGNTQGMPVEGLVNNTKWNGRRDGGGNDPIPGSTTDQSGMGVWMTALPRVGSTEVWEFLNMTMDAHPIHIHVVQFQLLNRQPVQLDPTTGEPTYMNTTWAAAFPGGMFNGEAQDGTWGPVFYPRGTIIPGYGPPNNYFDLNADGALGGNPAFSSAVFIGPPVPPSPQEAGWKDNGYRVTRLRHPPGDPLGAGGDDDRCCPAGAEPVFVRSDQGPWLPRALPHPRPRGQRNDAAIYPGAVAGDAASGAAWRRTG